MGMKNVSSEILLRRDFFSGVCEYHIEDTAACKRARGSPGSGNNYLDTDQRFAVLSLFPFEARRFYAGEKSPTSLRARSW